jgi:hypothetical protein
MLLRDHFPKIQPFLESDPENPHLIIAPPGRALILSELVGPCVVVLPTRESLRAWPQNHIPLQTYTEVEFQSDTIYLVEVLQPGAADADLNALLARWRAPNGSKLIFLASIMLPDWSYPYYRVITETVDPDARVEAFSEFGHTGWMEKLFRRLMDYTTSDLTGAFLVYVPTSIEVESLQTYIRHVPELQRRPIHIVTPWTNILPLPGPFSLVLDSGDIMTRSLNRMGGTRITRQPIPEHLAEAHRNCATDVYHLLIQPRSKVMVPPKGLLSPPMQDLWSKVQSNRESAAVIIALIDSYGPYFIYPGFMGEDSAEAELKFTRFQHRYFNRWRGVSDVDTLVAMWQQAQKEISDLHDVGLVSAWAQKNSVNPDRLIDAIETAFQLGRRLGQRDILVHPTVNILDTLRPLFAEVYSDKLLTNIDGTNLVYTDATQTAEFYPDSKYSVNDFGRVIPRQIVPLAITSVAVTGLITHSVDFALDIGRIIPPIPPELLEPTDGF